MRLPSNHMKPCGFSLYGNHLKLVCMAPVLCVQFVPARTSRFVVASGLARLALAWVIVKLQETFHPHTLSHTGGAARRVPGSLGWPKGLCGRQELVAGCCRHVLPWCSAAGGQYFESMWEPRLYCAFTSEPRALLDRLYSGSFEPGINWFSFQFAAEG